MISSVFARVLHREIRLRQLPETQFFAGTGLTEDMIWGAANLESSRFLRLLENARTLLGGEGLGFRVGAALALPAMSMMGIAMSSAPTLRDGLQSMASYSSLQADYVRFSLAAGPGRARIGFTLNGVTANLNLHVEAVLTILRDYITAVVGLPMTRARFLVSYTAPATPGVYEHWLGGPVHFDADSNGVEFPAEWLDARSPSSNAELWGLAREQLARELRAASSRDGSPFTDHLRAFLQAQRPPLPDIHSTAASLHLSTRTLNRRLSDEGQTFRQLRLDATHAWACKLLADGDTVEAVALALGYEDPANFRRSFRAHMGMSPAEWRERRTLVFSPADT